jgi:hypothetical protein
MQETPVFFSNETGKAQYKINLQELLHCMGDSGQAGLIRIEGLRTQLSKIISQVIFLKRQVKNFTKFF